MKFEGTQVFGLSNAIYGMRLPMSHDLTEAIEKSDSMMNEKTDEYTGEKLYEIETLGDNDLRIAKNLINADNGSAGEPNGKYLRMIHVQVAITAPLYWWKEADTYKVGTVSNSTSTMHKLASTPITMDCFEMDDFRILVCNNIQNKGVCYTDNFWENIIRHLETLRLMYNKTKDKLYWKELIRLLPESWLQTRMFDCNYQTLRNIYKWRKNHKLNEWHKFCEWIETLPYAKELITDVQ